MADVRDTEKDNSISAQADWGELNASTDVDSAPPPRSDMDSYPDEPWDDVSPVGAHPMAEDHNSAWADPTTAER